MPLSNHSFSKLTRRKKPKPSPVHMVFHNFANKTTMHGVPRIIHAETLDARIFWSLICIGAFGMFIWQAAILLQRYYAYPKKVNVEIIQRPVEFPSVTICNADHLNLIAVDMLEKLIQNGTLTNTSNEALNKFLREYDKFWTKNTKFFPVASSLNPGLQLTESMLDTFSRPGLIANLGSEVATVAGIQLDDFIFNCKFADKHCNVSQVFFKYFDNYYYNCYTFNPREILGDKTSRLQGVRYGFSVMLFSASAGKYQSDNDGTQMVPGIITSDNALASGKGARVMIHASGTEPHPEADGFDVPPGFSITIGVKARENVRINQPHGNCTRGLNVTTSKSYRYTLIGCQNNCIQDHIMEKCGCIDHMLTTPFDQRGLPFCFQVPSLPDDCDTTMLGANDGMDNESAVGGTGGSNFSRGVPDDHHIYGNVPPHCAYYVNNWLNRTNCQKKIYETMAIHDPASIDECNCFPPCNDISYEGSYSISLLPEQTPEHNWFYNTVKNFISRLSDQKKMLIERKNRKGILDNLPTYISRVNIHIADSNVIKTTESPDYESFRLISDMGGQLGLWVGISVMTLFEVVQLGADVLHFFTTPKKHRASGCPNHTDSPDTDNDVRYEPDRLTAV